MELDTTRLRRDLGTIEAYAAMIGILVGAGIFKVTGVASALTGPGVILGYTLLAVVALATAAPYAVFLSTPLGREPGGEIGHIAKTFGGAALPFTGAWLKMISYTGACAYLAVALADHAFEILRLVSGSAPADSARTPAALGSLAFFWAVHTMGVRWFGRVQVLMCTVLGASIVVLVVPGLFQVRAANFTPLLPGGFGGFAAALPPLFFAYAGFESLAQAGGEVRDSTRVLPSVFIRGLALTALIFVSMSAVVFGTLPPERVTASAAPMVEAAETFLPAGAAAVVALGGVMAVATSLNASLLVPARLGFVLSQERLLPAALGAISARSGVPAIGLALTSIASAALVVSGQVQLALTIAVAALLILYAIHGVALLVLPSRNPALFAQTDTSIPRRLQVAAAAFSVAAMAGLLAVQAVADVRHLTVTAFYDRWREHSLTSLELLLAWTALGTVLYAVSGRRRRRENP